ncbi:MAG: amino-acid N-acetyltransferase, partial [Pseudomonadota bacterium]|nr:amino-acid N-acetyltransferase [Pseudomonadota bacterium]
MTDSTDTIDWFRHTAPYINSHRGTTVVVGLRYGAASDKNFINVVHDLALMHSLGVRLVVVHEQNTFNSQPLTPIGVNQAVADTLAERTHIEQMFSMGLP